MPLRSFGRQGTDFNVPDGNAPRTHETVPTHRRGGMDDQWLNDYEAMHPVPGNATDAVTMQYEAEHNVDEPPPTTAPPPTRPNERQRDEARRMDLPAQTQARLDASEEATRRRVSDGLLTNARTTADVVEWERLALQAASGSHDSFSVTSRRRRAIKKRAADQMRYLARQADFVDATSTAKLRPPRAHQMAQDLPPYVRPAAWSPDTPPQTETYRGLTVNDFANYALRHGTLGGNPLGALPGTVRNPVPLSPWTPDWQARAAAANAAASAVHWVPSPSDAQLQPVAQPTPPSTNDTLANLGIMLEYAAPNPSSVSPDIAERFSVPAPLQPMGLYGGRGRRVSRARTGIQSVRGRRTASGRSRSMSRSKSASRSESRVRTLSGSQIVLAPSSSASFAALHRQAASLDRASASVDHRLDPHVRFQLMQVHLRQLQQQLLLAANRGGAAGVAVRAVARRQMRMVREALEYQMVAWWHYVDNTRLSEWSDSQYIAMYRAGYDILMNLQEAPVGRTGKYRRWEMRNGRLVRGLVSASEAARRGRRNVLRPNSSSKVSKPRRKKRAVRRRRF